MFCYGSPFLYKKHIRFCRKIKALTLPDNCLLITLGVESMCTKGLQEVKDAMGNYPIYNNPIIELLEFYLKNNEVLWVGIGYHTTPIFT